MPAHVVVAVLLGVGACAGEPADPCPTRTVRVGGADFHGDGFIDWEQGAAEPELITGPQGSEHIWFSFRSPDRFPGDIVKTRTALRVLASGKVVPPGITPVKIKLKRYDDGSWGYSGLRAFVLESCPVHGSAHQAWLEVEAQDGCTVTRRITVTPRWSLYDTKCPPP